MASDKNSIILTAQRLTAKGELDKAIEAWKSLIAETPNDGNIYNTIGDLYLKKNAGAKAIEVFLKAGSTFQEAGFALKTIAVYKKIIKLDPSRMDVVLKLADVNAERGIVGNAIEDYLKVARHELKEGRARAAIDVYRKMAALDPGNPTIGLKLAELCQKEGMIREAKEELTRAADHIESAGKTEGLSQIRAKLAELGGGEDHAPSKAERSFNAEASASSLGAETTLMTEAAPPRAEQSQRPPAAAASPRAEQSQRPPAPPTESMLEPTRLKTAQEFDQSTHERLRDALTETDVYVKYGMLDKAIAHVKTLAQRDPNDVAVQLKLKELYVSHGDARSAAETCRRLAEIYGVMGQEAEREAVLREAEELHPEAASSEAIPAERSVRPVDVAPEPPIEATLEGGGEIPVQDPLEQDLAEADFYFQQGFDDEARKLFTAILAKSPGHPTAGQRLKELAARAPSRQAGETSIAPTLQGADAEQAAITQQHAALEETSLGASLTLNAPVTEEPPRSAGAPSRSTETTKEEDYIDLVEALREDMERSVPPIEEEELSQELSAERELENVFRKFQKGIQDQYGKEDYETHYNLGVAYREMGLLNEAIGEFRLVLKSPDRAIAAASMIASCYRAKGALPRAEQTLMEVLNDTRYAKDPGLAGLAFELGEILEVQGRHDDALAQYYRAKELEPGHKEAAGRIAQLERPRAATAPPSAEKPAGTARPAAPQAAKQETRTARKKVSYL
ncbi:MAG: tetratricopeptide repeat protein [Nitrospirota bacterium]